MDNLAKTKHILAIDFGKSKVGLAFLETEARIAFPLEILMRDVEFLDKLEKIIKEKEIDLIVLGKPSWFQEKRDLEFEKMLEFIRDGLGIEVKEIDEMFTSKMAQSNLKEAGKKGIANDDAEAARIMLQEWFNGSR